ncbi:hypothetical protein QEN19_002867 [Hanseniaspora menglaensis]
MNFDDDITSIPLFDNILSSTETSGVLRTPKKSPSKKSRLHEIGNFNKFTFTTPEKSGTEVTEVTKTPRSSLKSFPSQTNINSVSRSTSPAKILSSYSKLLNENTENTSPRKLSPVRKLSLSPFSSPVKPQSPLSKSGSPIKGGTFMERRQLKLNQQRMQQKNKTISLSNNSLPTTPVKHDRVLKKVDFFSTPLINETINKSPKRKINDMKQISTLSLVPLTPQSLNKTVYDNIENEESSPKKKQKSPVKQGNETVKQKLIFEDDDDEEDHELKTEDENLISKESIDHVMFKQHMIIKHEFGVGLNANKFDPHFDTPHLKSREQEYKFMINHMQNKLSKNKNFVSDCLSIVGPPGTGKSKQVWQLLQYHYLNELLEFKPTDDFAEEFGNFQNVYCSLINCMAYLTVDQILETVSETLSTKTQMHINFYDITSFISFVEQTDLTIVLIMDEMDKFVQKHKKELYRLIDVAKKNQNFIIISITNSIEISNISSDFKLNQLLVKPYTIQQISEIITTKLEKVKERIISSLSKEIPSFDSSLLKTVELFQKSSLTLVSKKFGTQSGDLRDVTNFIYQILEIRESKALFDDNIDIITTHENKEDNIVERKDKVFHAVKDKKEMSEYILNHWSLKPIDFKTVAEVFKLSSDGFNIQKLLSKLNVWQQVVLIILCRLIQAEELQQLKSNDISSDQEFKGIPFIEAFYRYKSFLDSLKNAYTKKGESYSLLLEKAVQNNEFIKIIELLEACGIINKHMVKKKYYLVVRYDYLTIYQLLSHNGLLKECIEFKFF